ncbi:MAG: glycine oxidase ThiO [Planctomycetota bacterium]|nr:MAG: glycine oxidase ThiO [Planctomycetota bacterium]REJ94875.1 MAG: glycine oxidase ThiO [Planctomycetota bacterium]REK28863.1 MAG: glycine oxidase ThiO [Planctomycetota bacterium]REK39703.1 MAG: glycine oxidase ThiO [Planctomycetota bacterium]
MHDVVVIGGGVVGLSVAYECSRRGLSVVLLDQTQPGREASWAGAGILPPGHPGSPLAELSNLSTGLWPRWSAELREETGIDNGYRRCGGLRIPEQSPGETAAEVDEWRHAGVAADILEQAQIRECEPELAGPGIESACRLPTLAQVRNPWHLQALIAACARRGVDIRCGQPVTGFDEQRGRTRAVLTPGGPVSGHNFVVAAGAWSQRLLANSRTSIEIEPIRGQIVLLSTHRPLIRHVVEQGPRYLVPRPDGRTLVGSTEERAGFHKANTATAVSGLIAFAVSVVPALADSRFEQAWSGLRPRALRGLPYLGRPLNRENLFLAAGHFRDGLKLSPGTAVVLADLLTGQPPSIDIDRFAID